MVIANSLRPVQSNADGALYGFWCISKAKKLVLIGRIYEKVLLSLEYIIVVGRPFDEHLINLTKAKKKR